MARVLTLALFLVPGVASAFGSNYGSAGKYKRPAMAVRAKLSNVLQARTAAKDSRGYIVNFVSSKTGTYYSGRVGKDGKVGPFLAVADYQKAALFIARGGTKTDDRRRRAGFRVQNGTNPLTESGKSAQLTEVDRNGRKRDLLVRLPGNADKAKAGVRNAPYSIKK